MTTKTSFLMMFALTATIGCDIDLGDDIKPGDDRPDSDIDEDTDVDPDLGDDTGGDDGDDTGDAGDTGDIADVQAPPSADEFNALALDARDAYTQVHDVDTAGWTTVVGEDGTELFFVPDSFMKSDGTLADGDVQVELIEVFDKGAMLVTDMPSMGQNDAGELAQLISGGEHYVGATQDGEELRLNGTFQITTPASNTGSPDMEMTMFRAEVDDGVPAGRDDQAVWIEEEEDREAFGIAGEGGGADGADTVYWAISDQFGWTNIDRWYSDPRPKTTINVDVPDGWDDTNSAVYLSYDGEATALARMDTYDDVTGLFSEHYGLIPIGLEVHLIFVTESEDQWSYAIQGATIVEDHLTTFATADDFIETDTDGLVAVINALP